MKPSVAIFIYNPRILKTLLDIAKDYGIEFYVPEDLTSINDELLVDTEGLNILKDLVNGKELKYYLINSKQSIYKFILKTFGVKDVKVLQVGVDLGSKLAYVIVCDKILLKAGYVDSLDDLILIIEDFKNYLKPDKVVVKLGNTPYSSDWGLDRVLSRLVSLGFEVMIIDESRSSHKTQVRVYGFKTRFTADIYAALNIVFRDGVKVTTV
jgi:hypothetical protein